MPKQDPSKKKAPVDTVRLKKDLEEDKAWPMHFFAGSGETVKRMRGSVARSDTLKNARDGKIPAAAGVDTVRLKKDIADDARKLTDRAKLAGQLDAKGRKPEGDAAMSRSMDDMQRLTARQDTLEAERKRTLVAKRKKS